MPRFRSLLAFARRALRSRDLIAVAGIGCIAVGLATVAPALAWVAVGGFLIFAAGSGRGRGAA